MNVQKIGFIEAVFLICIVMANEILLNIQENIIFSTGSSAWVNVIFISIIAIAFTLLICKLFKKFAGKDILDICEIVGGKWLKLIIGIAYIGLFLLISSTYLKYFSESLKIIYFPQTPVFIISGIFLASIILANKLGFKVICSMNLGIVPLVLFSILVVFISNSKFFVPQRLFPILGYGIDETFFKGATNLFAFGGIAFLYFIMPILKDCNKFKKISVISIIVSSIYLFLSVVTLLLVFSFAYDANQTLAIYSLSRLVEFGRFLQRTDALFILFWILLVISYLSISMAFSINIFKKITNISNPKAIIYSFAVLMFTIGLFSSNIAFAKEIQGTVYRYFELILVYGISLVLLIIANLKNLKSIKKDVHNL